MKVLIVEPGKRPIKADIDHTLHNLQQVVGGYIQAIYPWDDPVALVCDEEGLLKQRDASFLLSTLNSFQGVLKMSSCGSI